MTDGYSLRQAILLSPADDEPRLAYADWLDEHGEPERAEFVRVQVELAKNGYWPCGKPKCDDLGYKLRHREAELWPFVSRTIDAAKLTLCVDSASVPQSLTRQEYEAGVAIVRRGFLDTVRAPLAVLFGGECERCEGDPSRVPWHGHGAACPACHGEGSTTGIAGDLFRREPVRRVEFTDREPCKNDVGYFWWYGDTATHMTVREQIPTCLWKLIYGYAPPPRHRDIEFHTYDAAIDALSTAACALARKRAGLTLEGASRE